MNAGSGPPAFLSSSLAAANLCRSRSAERPRHPEAHSYQSKSSAIRTGPQSSSGSSRRRSTAARTSSQARPVRLRSASDLNLGRMVMCGANLRAVPLSLLRRSISIPCMSMATTKNVTVSCTRRSAHPNSFAARHKSASIRRRKHPNWLSAVKILKRRIASHSQRPLTPHASFV